MKAIIIEQARLEHILAPGALQVLKYNICCGLNLC